MTVQSITAEELDKLSTTHRREFFRLVLPLTRRPLYSLPQGEAKPMQLPVIEMKDGHALEVALEVRNVSQLQRGNKVVGRIGCRFIELTHHDEHVLQRFITDVQREERAKLGV